MSYQVALKQIADAGMVISEEQHGTVVSCCITFQRLGDAKLDAPAITKPGRDTFWHDEMQGGHHITDVAYMHVHVHVHVHAVRY
jgi:hypothetical protein